MQMICFSITTMKMYIDILTGMVLNLLKMPIESLKYGIRVFRKVGFFVLQLLKEHLIG